MSALSQKILRISYEGNIYNIPLNEAEKFKQELNFKDSSLNDAGILTVTCLNGAQLLKSERLRSNYSLSELARLIKIDQSDLSKMERRKLPIGDIVAKRIGKFFKIHPQLFLSKSIDEE